MPIRASARAASGGERREVVEIETTRLRLRRFIPYDLDGLARIDAEPETRGFLWDGPVDRETTARHLRRWMGEYGRGLGHLAMIHKPDGELIGHCGLTERDGRVLLSYALRKDYWCRGLAPEAAAAVLSYGFEELGLEEIWTGTGTENRAWRGMMERLGMTLRETGHTVSGEEVCYAVSQEEFLCGHPLPEKRHDGQPKERTLDVDFIRRFLPGNLTRYLKGIEFPIDKEALIRRLEENGTPGVVVNQLRERLPEGQYSSIQDLLKNLGGSSPPAAR